MYTHFHEAHNSQTVIMVYNPVSVSAISSAILKRQAVTNVVYYSLGLTESSTEVSRYNDSDCYDRLCGKIKSNVKET